MQSDAVKFWHVMQELGYDLWLSLVNYESSEQPCVLSQKNLQQLLQLIEVDCCKETKCVLSYSPAEIRITQEEVPVQVPAQKSIEPINYDTEVAISKYSGLSVCKIREIRFSWSVLQMYNQVIQESLPIVNFSSQVSSSLESDSYLQLSLANSLTRCRELWMTPIKIDIVQQILQKTALPREQNPKIHIERIKFYDKTQSTTVLAKDAQDPAPDTECDSGAPASDDEDEEDTLLAEEEQPGAPSSHHTDYQISPKDKDKFMFLKAYEQIKLIDKSQLRPYKPVGTDPFLAFEVDFRGENVQGLGGPYRQFFSDISSELQRSSITSHQRNLGLLCPTVNNFSKLGEGKDKFTIKPSSRSSFQLQMYEFLGLLMGCSIRTGTLLQLDLPRIFWKQLVGQDIYIEDLEEIDAPFCSLLNYISSSSKDDFEQNMAGTFTLPLSDGKIIELKPNGKNITLTYENRIEFIKRALIARITESSQQVNAIRRGISKIVPAPLLQIMTHKDLEIAICGKKTIDFDLLKRHTRYSLFLNEDNQLINYLWETLNELDPSDRVRFVKFCWGQERLPENDEAFERNHIRFMIKPNIDQKRKQDELLPKADTCFFNFELPVYTKKETLKKQILTAIRFDCETINADRQIQLDPNAPQEEDGDHNYSGAEDNENY